MGNLAAELVMLLAKADAAERAEFFEKNRVSITFDFLADDVYFTPVEETMHFEIYSVKKPLRRRQWRWRLRARNGEIIAHGESYYNKEDCFRAVALVQDTSIRTRVEWPDSLTPE